MIKKITLLCSCFVAVFASLFSEPNLPDGNCKKSALMPARELQKKEIVVEAPRSEYMADPTALMEAIRSGKTLKEIKKLVKQGQNVHAIHGMCIGPKPVLSFALDRGNDTESLHIIRFLISKGANVNGTSYNGSKNKDLRGGMPLLSYASIHSSPEVVQILVDAGANANYKPRKNTMWCRKTALTIARELHKEEVVKILLKAGAE